MQKINSNNLTSKLVKNLISTSNIVTAPIWKQGQPTIEDMIYVTKNFIVRAKKTIGANSSNISVDDAEYFKKLSPFIEGNSYNALTANYMSNTGLYDSITHYFLGQYLRQLRDLHNIDLMQYYNCWDGTSIDSYRIVKNSASSLSGDDTSIGIDDKIDDNGEISLNSIIDGIQDAVYTYSSYYKLESNSKLDGYKLLLIPVKFNKIYTLYVNSDTPIKYGFAYYDGIGVLSDIDSSTGKPYNRLVGSRIVGTSDVVNTIDYVSYSSPVAIYSPQASDIFNTYQLTVDEGTSTRKIYLEDYLVMFLQIPSDNVSSVVVLEGNYLLNKLINTQTEFTKLSDDGTVAVTYRDLDNSVNTLTYRLPEVYYSKSEYYSSDDFVKSPSSLVISDDTNSYLFNSRLLEYLLGGVITWDDPISKDILYAHEDVSTKKCVQLNGFRYSGSDFLNYSSDFKKFIYKLATTTKKNPVLTDINGFIDKDTEDIVLRGKNRDVSKWGN